MSDTQFDGNGLSILLHSLPKVGKSSAGITAPGPRLLLDVEGGYKFHLNIKKVFWDPKTQSPPAAPVIDPETGEPDWDTCVVIVREWDDVLKAYEYLKHGSHSFKSVILDSVSEMQVKCKDALIGRNVKMDMQKWGILLDNMSNVLRDMRDLTSHATNPLRAVVLIAMTVDNADGKKVPLLQGQAGKIIPYLYDICGYLVKETFQLQEAPYTPYTVRRLYIEQNAAFEAGERVQGRLGTIVEQADLNVDHMIQTVFPA